MRTDRGGVNWLEIAQAVVLLAWTAALLRLCRGTGDEAPLGHFLRSSYWWVVYAAIVLFVIFLSSLLVGRWSRPGVIPWRSILQTVIMSLPLLYLPLAVSSELSIEAAEKRSLYARGAMATKSEISTPKSVASETADKAPETAGGQSYEHSTIVTQTDPPSSTPPALKPKKRTDKSVSAMSQGKSHEANLWNLISNPKKFEGSSAVVTGIVYQGKRLSSDSFFCYRLMMICCAADATPVGVIVKWREAAKLKKGSWVQVHGKAGFTTFEGEQYPAIVATKVDKTSPPKNKFLVPE